MDGRVNESDGLRAANDRHSFAKGQAAETGSSDLCHPHFRSAEQRFDPPIEAPSRLLLSLSLSLSLSFFGSLREI